MTPGYDENDIAAEVIAAARNRRARYSAIDVAAAIRFDYFADGVREVDGPDDILRLDNGQVFRIEVTELTTDYPDHPDYPGTPPSAEGTEP